MIPLLIRIMSQWFNIERFNFKFLMIEFDEQFLELILAYNSKFQMCLLFRAGTIVLFTVKVKQIFLIYVQSCVYIGKVLA